MLFEHRFYLKTLKKATSVYKTVCDVTLLPQNMHLVITFVNASEIFTEWCH